MSEQNALIEVRDLAVEFVIGSQAQRARCASMAAGSIDGRTTHSKASRLTTAPPRSSGSRKHAISPMS